MGWAKDKLSRAERSSIARGLFEVDDNLSNEVWIRGLCPIHGEKNSSFGYNVDDDFFNCFTCAVTGDLIDLFSQVNGYDKKAGFIEFQNRFDSDAHRRNSGAATARPAPPTPPPPKPKPEAPIIDEAIWEKMTPLPDSWQQRLLEKRGWTAKLLADMDIRLQTVYRGKKDGKIHEINKPERVAIPIRDAEGKLRNIRLYKPGAKEYKIISWGRDYGRARLFPALPAADETILLCEGEPDTLCALALGFAAITQTSKTRSWAAEHLAPFYNRDVVVCYDADQAGQKHAQHALKALAPVAASVRELEWPPFMGRTPDGDWPKDHGQDLTDYFIKHKKTPEDLRELIARAPVFEAPVEIAPEAPGAQASENQFFSKGINGRLSFKPSLLVDRIIKDVALLSDPESGILYRWNGSHWEDYSIDNVSAAALRYLGQEASKNRAEDVCYQVRRLSTIPHGRKVNDRGDWACLQNGMLNLKTLELKKHAKDFYATNILGVNFDGNSTKTCTRWLKFLDETIQEPDSIKQFQEFAGYCLTRDVKYAKCLLLIGDGSDGKSTALKILRQLVGKQNCSSVGFEDLDDQFHRSALKDKLLNVATEVGSKALESNLLKALVTGDEVRAAFKHKDGFDLESYCKFAFSANQLPRVLDNSDGFFRRLLIIRFKQQFMGADDDTNLMDTLTDELSEIFSWALVGLHRLREQGCFSDSAESHEIMQDYRRLNNPIQCFVEDCCALEAESTAVKDTLYNKYREYCGKYGYMPQNYENFMRGLRSAVKNLTNTRPRLAGGGRGQCLKGIRLVEV